jgi:hypothetical protein
VGYVVRSGRPDLGRAGRRLGHQPSSCSARLSIVLRPRVADS